MKRPEIKRPEVKAWQVAVRRRVPSALSERPRRVGWGTAGLGRLRRPPAVVAVVAVLAVGVTAAELTQPGAARSQAAPAAMAAPVVGSIAVCPDVVTTKAVATRVTAGAGGAGDVTVTAAALAPGAKPQTLAETGARVGRLAPGGAQATAVVATATGPQAGGLAVEQVTRTETGAGFGLASVRCEPAVADSWYVGAATTISDRSELVLVNPYDDVATVDVSLYTSKGALDAPGTAGVSVRPRSRVVKALADWAPDEAWLAVRVVVRSGRVSPAVRRTRSVRTVPSGVDWVPRSAPTGVATIGALPGGAGERTLVILNPGEATLTAHVQVTRQDGAFVPIDLAEIEVEPQELVAVSLTDELEGQSAMLQLETDGPAAVVGAYAQYTPAKGTSLSDFVYAGPAPVLSGPALLTDNRVGAGVDTALMFSAPEGDAEVTLTEVTATGGPGRQSLLPVRQGDLVVVALSRAFGRADPLPILVTTSANSAGVYGSRVIVEKVKAGTMLTALAIQPQPLAGVPVPRVTHDPAGWLFTRP